VEDAYFAVLDRKEQKALLDYLGRLAQASPPEGSAVDEPL
jgi:hypothetical protein